MPMRCSRCIINLASPIIFFNNIPESIRCRIGKEITKAQNKKVNENLLNFYSIRKLVSTPLMPLGILYVAGILEKNGFTVKVLIIFMKIST
jgi:hypothetical protein